MKYPGGAEVFVLRCIGFKQQLVLLLVMSDKDLIDLIDPRLVWVQTNLKVQISLDPLLYIPCNRFPIHYDLILLHSSRTTANQESCLMRPLAMAQPIKPITGFLRTFFPQAHTIGPTDRMAWVQYQKSARRLPNLFRMVQ